LGRELRLHPGRPGFSLPIAVTARRPHPPVHRDRPLPL